MNRPLLVVGAALLLVALLAPVALAAEGSVQAAEPAPAAEPTVAPEPVPTPVENGEITIDPTFIAASPAPVGEVGAATGRPDVTPPATDTLPPSTASGTGLGVLLVLAVGGSPLALLAGRIPAVRRR